MDTVVDPFGVLNEWNAAIGEHFFSENAAGKAVRLTLDDVVAKTIAKSTDIPIKGFLAAVGELVVPDEPDAFVLLRAEGVHYHSLTLLALQVLAASHMGEGDMDPKNFWAIFWDLIQHELSEKQKEHLTQKWFECRRYYTDDRKGTRGHLSLPANSYNVPLVNRRHINLPLWQVALRETDREQLRKRFLAWPQGQPKNLLAAVVEWKVDLNATLRNTLKLAADNGEFGAELELMLLDVWRQAQGLGAPESRASKSAWRIRLVGRTTLACSLQKRNAAGEWSDVDREGDGGALSRDEMLAGVEDTPFGGCSVGAFMRTEHEGFVHTGGLIQGVFDGIIVMVADDDLRRRASAGAADLDALREALEERQWQRRRLSADLDGFEAYEGKLTPADDDVASLAGIEICPPAPFVLEGGLRVGGHAYVFRAPPRLRLEAPGAECVVLDRVTLLPAAGGLVLLPPELCIGTHTVSFGSYDSVVEIVECPIAQEDEYDALGISLDPTRRLATIATGRTGSGLMLVGAEFQEAR